ncbi:c-type cytochrome [Polymorphobacter fuscus]|uniref:c-type cytochrome n=1 Tax=Sandarakinorhabdus fusca TaxID=1439888 RepID=UPI00143224A9|nr:c-type cytochrome [Polymorphobacter fuscus]NJC08933.1 cytochrome c553 [Polymorphobacter fuscus]
MSQRRTILATLFPARVTQWFGPALVAGGAAAIIGVVTVTSGVLDLTASTPHPQGWATFLHYVFNRSVAHHSADLTPPADLDSEPRIIKGAVYYSRVCANCHAGPGFGQSPVALALRPQPQYLVTQAKLFDASGLFWIVKHGVKYSAMPAWTTQSRDDEVWSIVAFLRALPGLDNARYQALAGMTPDPVPAAAPAQGEGSYHPDIAMNNGGTDAVPDYSVSRPAVAFGRGSIGADPTLACVQCHGADGAGRAGAPFPNLTLLDRVTFKKALTQFATGARHSGYMQPVAAQLTNAQIDALTAAFGAMPRRPSPQFAATPAQLALGEQIANKGIPAARVNACQICHAINRADSKLYPAIAGQNVWYLRDQLALFRAGQRDGGDPINPMLAAAHGLTDPQIAAVSAWYAARPPEAPAAVPENPKTAAD